MSSGVLSRSGSPLTVRSSPPSGTSPRLLASRRSTGSIRSEPLATAATVSSMREASNDSTSEAIWPSERNVTVSSPRLGSTRSM